jgi:sec-independent protein translocase protein TatB
MFDVGFSELIVIAIVALVVIGPERLPKVARTAGHLLGRLQRYVNDVKADVAREMQLDELKKLQSQMQDSVRNLESTMKSEMAAVEKSVEETAQSARAALADATQSVNEAVAPAATPLEMSSGLDAPTRIDGGSLAEPAAQPVTRLPAAADSAAAAARAKAPAFDAAAPQPAAQLPAAADSAAAAARAKG